MDQPSRLHDRAPREESPVCVVYIVGAPRSGSTLLDIILGAHPAVESVGELRFLADRGWCQGEYCACGQRGNECVFWSKVRREWSRRAGTDDVQTYGALIRDVEMANSWMLELPRQRRRPSPRFQAYADQTRALFEAIRAVSGRPVIVDSSKLRSRAYALSMVPGIDLRILHLTRDARGLVWSTKKRLAKDERRGVPQEIRPKPTWRMALGWVLVNLQSDWIGRQLGPERALSLRYEDLIADPGRILEETGRFLGLDLEEVGRRLVAGEPIEVRHPIAGNRMRMAGQVRLQPDLEWQTRLSAADRWLCWTITGWLMRRYGYERRPKAA